MADLTDASHYFGDRPDSEIHAMSAHSTRSTGVEARQTERGMSYHSMIPKPMSFLRPMTPYGDTYTPSYTRYLNTPGSSYNNPLFPLFNDRRPQPRIRTSLSAGQE